MMRQSLREVKMDEDDFEGTLVLEQLAELDLVEDFFDAIDSDDIERAILLMKKARVDAETIALVVGKIVDGDDEY
ncbi:MAG: hypothetical protein H7177_02550 [Rhizobacter sp.]|nr:hypothetical protein [Bacteriovorax sp.]